MSKRLGAALAALLTFAAVLAVVPLVSAEPADAHTKTIQRCSYDPFAGRQCWNESVPHTHPKPKPKTSTNYAPPPDTSPTTTTTTTPTTVPVPKTCPSGTTGTPPNCQPVPSDNTRSAPKTCPDGTTGTPPDCLPVPSDNTRSAPKTCPDGTTGTPPDCLPVPPDNTNRDATKCPEGTTGTPPKCQQTSSEEPPPKCLFPKHAHGDECHEHILTPPRCGTGTWIPHHGHTPQPRPPCPTTTTTTPPECRPVQARVAGTVDTHRHLLGAQRNRGGGTMSDCHPTTVSHCAANQHEHVHGSQNCHAMYTRLSSSLAVKHHHCPDGQHEHTHDSGQCHPEDEVHCEDGEHHHYMRASGLGGSDRCHDIGDHPWFHEECDDGEHNHRDRVFREVRGCHDASTKHSAREWTRTDEFMYDVTGEVVCFIPGGAVAKVVKLLQKGASWLRKLVTSEAAGWGAGVGCGALWDRYVKEGARQHPDNQRRDHDDVDDESATTTTAAPRPPTTEGPPKPTTTPAPPTTTPQDAWNDAMGKFIRGEIDRAGLQAAADAYQCALGVQSKCK